MPTTKDKIKTDSKRVDAYIKKSPAFSHPILKRIRSAFLKGHPEIKETIKWGAPHYEYHGIVGGMAAFKNHVGLGFWKARLMKDPKGIFEEAKAASMCTAKIRTLKDLPSERVLISYVKEAAKINASGAKTPGKKPLPTPTDLKAALAKNKKAKATFDQFAPSHKREYITWITEAKQAATRERRLKQAITWMAQGKQRNWKYAKKG